MSEIKVRSKIILHIVFCCIAISSLAQTPRPLGNFLTDSIKIGQPVKYALSFHHPKNMELFFPDSTYSFLPFEFIGKEYFPTRTTDSISIDSVVYTLRTFEIKNSIELSLPVFIVEHGDTIRQYSTHDGIGIRQYVKEVPDSLQLINNTIYIPVEQKSNYPYYLTALFLGFLISVFLYFALGKAVLRNYRLYMMYNNHIQFLRKFEKLHKEMQESPNLAAMETILGEWKDYLTRLEHKPINTFTTTEIISLFNKEDLKESLQEVDRTIYSASITGDPYKALSVLKKFSNKRYKKRRKELKNAR
jgi:hypothetical protein